MKKFLLLVAACVMGFASAWAQWNSDPAINTTVWFNDGEVYDQVIAMTPQGNTWIAFSHPKDGHISVSLQMVDTAGILMFEEPLLVSDFDSRTWNSFGQILFVDRDGNAIVAVTDQRYGSATELENHTVYKISPEGEFLWGEDGITLEGENVYDMVAAMSMCQLADGSYVFAWMHNYENNYNHFGIEMQRVSPEGEMLWNAEEVRLHDNNITYMYPYVVDGGNNQVILIYAKGSSQDLYARKIDFDGTTVWSEDTKVYNGGWGSIPIWTLLDVHPSGDGGVLLSWNDDRYYTEFESAYIAYVQPNGEMGFNVNNGLKLGYNAENGLRSLEVRCLYDKNSDSFYAVWNECSAGQSWYRVVGQRISKEGELLWSEYGVELQPLEQTNYGCLSLQSGTNDEVAFFYMRDFAGNFGNVEAFISTVNVNDTTIRRESQFTKSTRISQKSALATTSMHDGKFWVVKWKDLGCADDEEKVTTYLMQRVNNDLSLGNPEDAAVENVKTDNNTFVALSTVVENEAMFAVNVPAATQATLAIYNVNGALVATPYSGVLSAGERYISWNATVPAGIYVATLTTADGVETVKLLVK